MRQASYYSSGGNVVFVSRQRGHGSADITLRVFAHTLFDAAEHAFAAVVDGNGMENTRGSVAQHTGRPEQPGVALLRGAGN